MRVKSLKLTEKEFQAQVIQLAKLRGWMVYHTHDSRRSTAGFPDLVLVRPPLLIFVEVKLIGKYPSSAQQTWLNALLAANQHASVWRPSDWPEIERILA